MELEKNQLDAARKTYKLYWKSFANGDIDGFTSAIDDSFEMFGTSETGVSHSKADENRFLITPLNELVGKAELRNRQFEFIPVDMLLLVKEQCDIYVLTNAVWNFYFKIRVSTFLKETEAGWKLIQQHCSFPDTPVQENEIFSPDKPRCQP